MRKITVFYAWQNDTPPRFNRYLIRMAMEAAARRINDDTTLNLEPAPSPPLPNSVSAWCTTITNSG
jgi:hypothetical protein